MERRPYLQSKQKQVIMAVNTVTKLVSMMGTYIVKSEEEPRQSLSKRVAAPPDSF